MLSQASFRAKSRRMDKDINFVSLIFQIKKEAGSVMLPAVRLGYECRAD
jgi:hypothetical protein